MKYAEFYIKNYKGIKELTLRLDKDPKSNVTTLVGLNESGKTTILEAISLLQNGVQEDKRYTLIPKSKKRQFSESIEIHAKLKLDDSDEEKIKNWCWEYFKVKGVIPVKEVKHKLIYNFKNSEFIQDRSVNEFELKIFGKPKRHSNPKLLPIKQRHRIIELLKSELLPSIIYYPNFLFNFPEKLYLEDFENAAEEQVIYREVLNLKFGRKVV